MSIFDFVLLFENLDKIIKEGVTYWCMELNKHCKNFHNVSSPLLVFEILVRPTPNLGSTRYTITVLKKGITNQIHCHVYLYPYCYKKCEEM